MPSPGDSFRGTWTAQFANEIRAMLGRGNRITGSGGINISSDKSGTQLAMPPPRLVISTLQGTVIGGAFPPCTDGTTILDMYAWNAYSIQGGAFITSAGTTVISVQVNSTPVSWLTGLTIDSSGIVVPIPNPVTDQTHVIPVGAQLTIVTSSSSGDCAGLQFNLNCPF